MEEDRTSRFEALYAATFHHLLGYATRRCESAEDAADVVAETFAVTWRRLDVVPPGDQARLWLYGVARNVLAEHRRGAARRRDLSHALAGDLTGCYAPSAEDSADLSGLGRAMRHLPEEDRELLCLVAWEGLDNGQIAAVLGVSRNAVRIRLHRARRRLARRLAGPGGIVDRPAMSGGSR